MLSVMMSMVALSQTASWRARARALVRPCVVCMHAQSLHALSFTHLRVVFALSFAHLHIVFALSFTHLHIVFALSFAHLQALSHMLTLAHTHPPPPLLSSHAPRLPATQTHQNQPFVRFPVGLCGFTGLVLEQIVFVLTESVSNSQSCEIPLVASEIGAQLSVQGER
eukprot:1195183-Rhodomonas_salina.1